MTDDDPNEGYEVVLIEAGPHGSAEGWWTVMRNGKPVRNFPGKEKAERFATDPEYRASLVTAKVWKKAKKAMSERGLVDPKRALAGLYNAVVFGRMVTFALQNMRNEVSGFEDWYAPI
ncbi:MAG: hypothetical protein JWP25_7170 [Bradyrhizobium sp.]|nr:hypothetical protein [Bradyrhizobium sp.]